MPGYADDPPRGRRQPRKKRRSFWRWAGYFFLFCLLVGLGAGAAAAKYVYDQYQLVKSVSLENIDWDLSTVIYDRNGRELRKINAGEDRIFVPLKEVPPHVQDAVVAIEDARFWQHKGLDPYRIAGAAIASAKHLLFNRGNLEGASTITQQLARNAFLTQDVKLSRKVQEAILAIQLEMRLSKQEILEKYLNEIFFGHNANGIGAAARLYFGKAVKDLTLAEGALLAGVIQQPNYYSPYNNPEAAMERMRVVLAQMVRFGFITPAQAEAAKKEKLTFPGIPRREQARLSYTGSHYVDYVLDLLTTPAIAEQYGITPFDEDKLFRGGYRIYTAIDPGLQQVAEEAVATAMDPAFAARKGVPGAQKLAWDDKNPQNNIQAAVVMMNPKTGEVLAIVGGRTHKADRELNRATSIYRQPGSTFKPLAVYGPAFDLLGYGPGTVIDDAPFMYSKETGLMWPENFEHEYQGLVPIRWAVEQSRNAVAVQVMNRVGPSRAFEFATRLGIRNLQPAGPRNDVNLAMGLGGLTKGVTLLEMTHAYATLANLGLRVDPVVVTRIVDRYGTTVYEARPRRQQVMKESAAWLLVDTMKGTIQRGTAYYLTQGFKGWPAAGKTGTTESNVDAWFIGFTPDLVTGVWNGYDNQSGQKYLPYTGAWVPVLTWNEIMTRAVKEKPQDWQRPSGVVSVEICAKTGLLPSPRCPQKVTEWFARGTEPKEFDVKFWSNPVQAVQEKVRWPGGGESLVWKLWQPGCAGAPVTRSFLIRPDFPRHPDPNQMYSPKWVPRDVAETLPQQSCTPAGPPASRPEASRPEGGQPPGTDPGNGTDKGGGVGIPGLYVPAPDQKARP